MNRMIQKIAFVFLVILLFQSCTTVREYEKEKINDPDMKLSARSTERYETAFQLYRKAAEG